MKTKAGICIAVCFSIFALTQAGLAQQALQQKCQVIRCLLGEIIPASATISRGTTVVWINESPGEIEVQFTNTESIYAYCENPVRFIKDPIRGQLVSDKIPFAGVGSICFIQKGEFSYTIKRFGKLPADNAKELAAKIVVQ
jgi:hypothetical protein